MRSPYVDPVQRSRTFPGSGGKYTYHSKSRTAFTRIASSPDVSSELDKSYIPYVASANRPPSFRKPIRDWDLWDDYWADRKYYMTPLYWPHQSFVTRRYNFLDPPYNLWWNYPALPWYPRGNRQVAIKEQLDPLYARRYRDPNYDQPMWKPSRQSSYSPEYRMESWRVLQMYQQKLIDYDTLSKNWLTPFSMGRKLSQYETQPQKEEEEAKKRIIRASSVGRSIRKR